MTSVWSLAIAKRSHVRSVVEDTVLVLGGSEAGRGPVELEHSSPDGSGVCNGASELRKRALQAQLEGRDVLLPLCVHEQERECVHVRVFVCILYRAFPYSFN